MLETQDTEFNIKSKKVAENIYRAMINNYDPIPDYLITNKDDIVEFLKDAWIHGANWRYGDMYKKGLIKFY